MIMSRFTLVIATALTLVTTAAQAGTTLNDATRYGHIVTTHGVWDSR
jgi:hypothetical protein